MGILAKYYYIYGRNSKIKRIDLDRELLKCELDC